MYVLEMLTKPADAAKLDEDDLAEIQAKHAAFREKYEGNKTLIAGAGLTYLGESVSVDSAGVHEGSGELAKSREVTAFYVVDCDRATALDIAAELIDKHVVSVNVREVHHSNGLD